jgi:Plasmid replication region DNA-binding N-term
MSQSPGKAYGEGRVRLNVSYGEVERAAIAILKSERRPTVETVREALGRGSPDTIGNALKRFWRDLGVRIEGDPAALTRLPAEIADLADGMWQRALKLAAEAARHDDNAARERLAQIQVENELRAQSFALRETEWDTAARARERALADSRAHLLLLTKTLGRDQATLRARDARIADLESQVDHYRRQITTLMAVVVAKSSRANTQRRVVRTESAAPRSVSKPRPRSGETAIAMSKVARRGAKSGSRHM